MRKYVYIFLSEIMSNLQYIGNIILGFIGYLIHIFVFLNLWEYLYSDSTQVINGYTMKQMVWYVIITELLWMIVSGNKYCKKIINDVRSGNIAYNITKPYNYILYAISGHLGECVVRGIIYIILSMGIGLLFLGSFPKLNILSILLVFISFIMAILINMFFSTFIGLLSFFIEDATPFYWLYGKLVLILGTIFPIEFFPKFIRPILSYSPIYAMSYGPAKLFVDFDFNMFFKIFISQIIYIIISYIMCLLLFRKGVKKLNVNGG